MNFFKPWLLYANTQILASASLYSVTSADKHSTAFLKPHISPIFSCHNPCSDTKNTWKIVLLIFRGGGWTFRKSTELMMGLVNGMVVAVGRRSCQFLPYDAPSGVVTMQDLWVSCISVICSVSQVYLGLILVIWPVLGVGRGLVSLS